MREVGITMTGLMSVYFAMANTANSNGLKKLTPNGNGDYVASTAPTGIAMVIEPVRKIEISTAVSYDIYFVPALNFQGIKINGSAVTVTDVEADGKSLWMYDQSASAVVKVSL